MGFFSCALRNAKKILISPPKSFHDWKMKFFFIRVEVIPMEMTFRGMGSIPKEDVKVPHSEGVGCGDMSDKWPKDSESVHVLLFDGQAALYQSVFPTFARVMGTRPLRDGEEFWLEQIGPTSCMRGLTRLLSLLSQLKVRASPILCLVGLQLLMGKRLSSFPVRSRWKTTRWYGGHDARVRKRGLERPRFLPDPLSDHEEEAGVDPEAEKLIRKNALKRSHAETQPESSPAVKKVAIGKPAIGKKGELRDLYTEVSPEILKKPAARPKPTVLPPNTAAEKKEAESSKAEKGLLISLWRSRMIWRFSKLLGLMRGLRTQSRSRRPPIQTENIASTVGGAVGDTCEEEHVGAQHVAGKGAGGSGADTRKGTSGKKPRQPSPIRAEDMLSDMYYKTYDDSRANELHAPGWGLSPR
ncbi:hypothetical protein Hanom_Chr06g00541491 [Helianthus anomalus]